MKSVTLPRWTPNAGRARVAVVAEQGLGDMLLLARLLERFKRTAEAVAVFVPPSLVRLFRQSCIATKFTAAGHHNDRAAALRCVYSLHESRT